MRKTALTAVTIFLITLGPSLLAGPEPLLDPSKDKEVQMVQPPVCDPRWYISLGGSVDFNIGDTKINQELIERSIGAPFTDLFIRKNSFDDVYGTGWNGEGEIGYALTQHLEVFGTFRYAHADGGNRVTGGEVVSNANQRLVFPISFDFDDYDAWGGELGFRFYFLSRDAKWRPYIAFSGGASHVDNIDMSAFIDLRDIGGPRDFRFYQGGFFNDSWVSTAAATLGLELNVTCHWTLGVNGGIRYASRLDDNDSDLNRGDFFIPQVTRVPVPLGFARPINDDSGDRWTVPVTGYVKFRF